MNKPEGNFALRAAAVGAVLFGAMTISAGGLALFGGDSARQAAGAYVAFVLWFNFVAGFGYVVAGVGLWLRRRWAVLLAGVLALATALVLVAFGAHVASGGLFESRTVVAMTIRLIVWVWIARIAYQRLWRPM